MKQNPYQVIRVNYLTYSKVFRMVADAILAEPERIMNISIQQLAQELDIAESSIVRFCRVLGFTGFSELKIMLARYDRQQIGSIYENLEDDHPEVITRNIFALNVKTLQTAVEQLDFLAISTVAEMMNQAKRILVCGVGTSASIAENFAVHLMRVGFQATAVTDSELLQMAARMTDDKTLLLAVSKSGRNIPLVSAFHIAREHGAKTACMTGYEKTPLGQYCDVSIVHYCPSAQLMSTRIIQNTLIDCLCVNATVHQQEAVRENLKENHRVIEDLRI